MSIKVFDRTSLLRQSPFPDCRIVIDDVLITRTILTHIADGFALAELPEPFIKTAVFRPYLLKAPGTAHDGLDLPRGADHPFGVHDSVSSTFLNEKHNPVFHKK